DAMRAVDRHVVDVEEDDEDAGAGILRRLTRFFDGVRLTPQILRQVAANDHVLELLDLLRRAALEDLEVTLREVRDRRAILRGIDVHADVVRLGAERWLRGLRGPLLRGLTGRECGDERSPDAEPDAVCHQPYPKSHESPRALAPSVYIGPFARRS